MSLQKRKTWREQYDHLQKLIYEFSGDLEAMAFHEDLAPPSMWVKLQKFKLTQELIRVKRKMYTEPKDKFRSVLPEDQRTCFYSEEALE